MPQTVQIVPKWLHSHVETYVNDYTQFNDTVSTPVDTNNQFICVFRSPMGEDNKIIDQKDFNKFRDFFIGGSNKYDAYGQPLMMPLAMLSSGSATVHAMRVMPEDAYAANSILCLLYKTDPDTGKFTIKFKAYNIDKSAFAERSAYSSNKAFKKYLKIYGQTLRTTTPDEDGFIQIPLVVFRMSGRGIYGNNYRWRITRDADYEYDYQIKMFSFEALSTIGGLSKKASYVGCLTSSEKYKQITLINDVMDEQDAGVVIMDVDVYEDYFEEVYDAFVEFVESLDEELQDDIPAIDEFDPFFGLKVASMEPNSNIEIISEDDDEDCISVDRPQGITLAGGDDGAFTDITTEEGRGAELQAYIDAFTGELDRHILSPRRVPCDVLLDANYPFEVKEAIAELANLRDSSLLYLDMGTDTTVAQVDNLIDQYAGFNNRNISKEWQHYIVKDPLTNKKRAVTITYFYALQIPIHYQSYGSWVPFVKSRAQLYGHIKNSLEPSVEDIDMELKEKLYVNRINYFETISENVYQRCSQNTSQVINSDLVEENNMNTLFELKRIVELDAWSDLYNFTSAESRKRFSEYENSKFSSWIGTRVQSLNIDFSVNEWEMERSIVHCYISVQFRNLNKRTIIEIDINKRDFLA